MSSRQFNFQDFQFKLKIKHPFILRFGRDITLWRASWHMVQDLQKHSSLSPKESVRLHRNRECNLNLNSNIRGLSTKMWAETKREKNPNWIHKLTLQRKITLFGWVVGCLNLVTWCQDTWLPECSEVKMLECSSVCMAECADDRTIRWLSVQVWMPEFLDVWAPVCLDSFMLRLLHSCVVLISLYDTGSWVRVSTISGKHYIKTHTKESTGPGELSLKTL